MLRDLLGILLLLLTEVLAVVAPQRPPHQLRAVEVVHREHGTPLVLVRDEGEPLCLAGLLLSRDEDVDNLAEL